MATQTKKQEHDSGLHLDGDQMPYVWPRGHTIGPRTGQHVWQTISVLLVLVLIGLIIFMASKSW